MPLQKATASDVIKRLTIGAYDLATVMIPARNGQLFGRSKNDCLSGDWWGAGRAQNAVIRIVLADLRGKGNGAKPYHDYLASQLRNRRSGTAVDWLLDLRREWPGQRSATIAVVDVDTIQHQARFASAAHPAPILKNPETEAEFTQTVPLGLIGADGDLDHVPLNVSTTRLKSLRVGSSIVLISDGILDAGQGKGDPFGKQRLLPAINSATSAECIASTILNSVFDHLGDHPAEDDMSVVVISRTAVTASGCNAA